MVSPDDLLRDAVETAEAVFNTLPEPGTIDYRNIAVSLWSYECDEPHWNEKRSHYATVTWEEIEQFLNGDHCGDCTKESHTCMRCLAEHIVHKAKYISGIINEES